MDSRSLCEGLGLAAPTLQVPSSEPDGSRGALGQLRETWCGVEESNLLRSLLAKSHPSVHTNLSFGLEFSLSQSSAGTQFRTKHVP